jgi:hypothetical protein
MDGWMVEKDGLTTPSSCSCAMRLAMISRSRASRPDEGERFLSLEGSRILPAPPLPLERTYVQHQHAFMHSSRIGADLVGYIDLATTGDTSVVVILCGVSLDGIAGDTADVACATTARSDVDVCVAASRLRSFVGHGLE